tara:strand:- start:130 stop:363 length:234 start_codon:yes stop_codon:yes gene_type:complete
LGFKAKIVEEKTKTQTKKEEIIMAYPKKKLHGRKATGRYSTCVHCHKDDATYMKNVRKQSYTGKRTWCARCQTQASF